MELKMSSKTFHEVDYGDFERFVAKVYGFGSGAYSFVADMEMGNDSNKSFTVDPTDFHDEWDIRSLNKFIDSKGRHYSYITYILLQELHFAGYIPAGNYIIDVCW